MTYAFYAFLSLVLIVFQTAILPRLLNLGGFFDLLVTVVIYLGLFRPVRESIVFIVVLGMVVDSLSASPFLLYVTAYFWVFIAVRWLNGVLQIGMRFRFPVIVALGVLVENTVIVLAVSMLSPGLQSPSALAGQILVQLIWAVPLGSLFVIIFAFLYDRWDRLVGEYIIRRSDMTDRNAM
jgi:cell shape-determining protein MreD